MGASAPASTTTRITRQPQLPLKYAGCRPFHHNRGPFTLPFNDQRATPQFHFHAGIQQACKVCHTEHKYMKK